MIAKMSNATWQEVIDVHLTGSLNFLQAVGRHFLERLKAGDTGPRSIVNISSDAGRRGTIGQINYGAAKAGVLGLRSEEHTSELQSLMRISYAVFCLKKKHETHHTYTHSEHNPQSQQQAVLEQQH